MRNRHKTLLSDHSVSEVILKTCPRHYSVSAICETLTVQGPNRPPRNGGEFNLRGFCSTGRQQVFQFQSFLSKLVLYHGNPQTYPHTGVSVSRYYKEGTIALNCVQKIRRIFSYLDSVYRCWTINLLSSNHRN